MLSQEIGCRKPTCRPETLVSREIDSGFASDGGHACPVEQFRHVTPQHRVSMEKAINGSALLSEAGHFKRRCTPFESAASRLLGIEIPGFSPKDEHGQPV